jgi:hypothetical protein
MDGKENGGWGRNRTGVHGFAGRCITTLPPSLNTHPDIMIAIMIGFTGFLKTSRIQE